MKINEIFFGCARWLWVEFFNRFSPVRRAVLKVFGFAEALSLLARRFGVAR